MRRGYDWFEAGYPGENNRTWQCEIEFLLVHLRKIPLGMSKP